MKMNKKIDYNDHAFEYDKYMGMWNIGTYRMVRSSEQKNAMVHWKTLCMDKESNRWFEAAGGAYGGWKDSKLSIEQNDMDIEDLHIANPKLTVRESYWDFLWGDVLKPVEANACVWFFEYIEGEEHEYVLELKNVPLRDLEELKQAVYEWHRTGMFKFGKFDCDPCRE